MFTMIAVWINNFFRRMSIAARPVWEYRLRFDLNKNCWVIELKENDNTDWKPICERNDTTRNEQLLMRFATHAEAQAHAVQIGLHNAYERAYFTTDRKTLPEATPAIERNIAETTAPVITPAILPARSVVRPLTSHNHTR